jgi:hypothetical protein
MPGHELADTLIEIFIEMHTAVRTNRWLESLRQWRIDPVRRHHLDEAVFDAEEFLGIGGQTIVACCGTRASDHMPGNMSDRGSGMRTGTNSLQKISTHSGGSVSPVRSVSEEIDASTLCRPPCCAWMKTWNDSASFRAHYIDTASAPATDPVRLT